MIDQDEPRQGIIGLLGEDDAPGASPGSACDSTAAAPRGRSPMLTRAEMGTSSSQEM